MTNEASVTVSDYGWLAGQRAWDTDRAQLLHNSLKQTGSAIAQHISMHCTFRATQQPAMHPAVRARHSIRTVRTTNYVVAKSRVVFTRASADTTSAPVDTVALWAELGESCAAFKKAPLSMVSRLDLYPFM